MAASSVEGLGEFRRHTQGLEGSYQCGRGAGGSICFYHYELPLQGEKTINGVSVLDESHSN